MNILFRKVTEKTYGEYYIVCKCEPVRDEREGGGLYTLGNLRRSCYQPN